MISMRVQARHGTARHSAAQAQHSTSRLFMYLGAEIKEVEGAPFVSEEKEAAAGVQFEPVHLAVVVYGAHRDARDEVEHTDRVEVEEVRNPGI